MAKRKRESDSLPKEQAFDEQIFALAAALPRMDSLPVALITRVGYYRLPSVSTATAALLDAARQRLAKLGSKSFAIADLKLYYSRLDTWMSWEEFLGSLNGLETEALNDIFEELVNEEMVRFVLDPEPLAAVYEELKQVVGSTSRKRPRKQVPVKELEEYVTNFNTLAKAAIEDAVAAVNTAAAQLLPDSFFQNGEFSEFRSVLSPRADKKRSRSKKVHCRIPGCNARMKLKKQEKHEKYTHLQCDKCGEVYADHEKWGHECELASKAASEQQESGGFPSIQHDDEARQDEVRSHIEIADDSSKNTLSNLTWSGEETSHRISTTREQTPPELNHIAASSPLPGTRMFTAINSQLSPEKVHEHLSQPTSTAFASVSSFDALLKSPDGSASTSSFHTSQEHMDGECSEGRGKEDDALVPDLPDSVKMPEEQNAVLSPLAPLQKKSISASARSRSLLLSPSEQPKRPTEKRSKSRPNSNEVEFSVQEAQQGLNLTELEGQPKTESNIGVNTRTVVKAAEKLFDSHISSSATGSHTQSPAQARKRRVLFTENNTTFPSRSPKRVDIHAEGALVSQGPSTFTHGQKDVAFPEEPRSPSPGLDNMSVMNPATPRKQRSPSLELGETFMNHSYLDGDSERVIPETPQHRSNQDMDDTYISPVREEDLTPSWQLRDGKDEIGEAFDPSPKHQFALPPQDQPTIDTKMDVAHSSIKESTLSHVHKDARIESEPILINGANSPSPTGRSLENIGSPEYAFRLTRIRPGSPHGQEGVGSPEYARRLSRVKSPTPAQQQQDFIEKEDISGWAEESPSKTRAYKDQSDPIDQMNEDHSGSDQQQNAIMEAAVTTGPRSPQIRDADASPAHHREAGFSISNDSPVVPGDEGRPSSTKMMGSRKRRKRHSSVVNTATEPSLADRSQSRRSRSTTKATPKSHKSPGSVFRRTTEDSLEDPNDPIFDSQASQLESNPQYPGGATEELVPMALDRTPKSVSKKTNPRQMSRSASKGPAGMLGKEAYFDDSDSEGSIIPARANNRAESYMESREATPACLTPRKWRKQTGKTSRHFSASPGSKTLTPKKSCLPFPRLPAASFGLIQEELAHKPFQLLVAVSLLNKTKGAVAIPVCDKFFARWPTPEALAHANEDDVYELLKPLGFGSRRTESLLKLARTWITNPPRRGQRYRTPNYPFKGSSRKIGKDEVLKDDDPRPGAFEIAHLPGVGEYALDSWRIFCRDELRGLAQGYNGEGRDDLEHFEPEWQRVVPQDKELRAFLRWMWLREGWVFDPETGEKTVASEAIMREASGEADFDPPRRREGRVSRGWKEVVAEEEEEWEEGAAEPQTDEDMLIEYESMAAEESVANAWPPKVM